MSTMAVGKKLIVGNWKMNLNVHEASLFLHKLAGLVSSHRDVEVVLAPTLLALQSLSLQIDHRQFKLAVQNLYWRDSGAFTGEVSAAQLRGVVDYAIIGHSERRHIFGETDKDIRSKVQAAIRNGIKPILCIGETATERADGETAAVLHDQLIGGLANLTSEEIGDVAVAYEPVWAIGTGNDATPSDVKAVTAVIRRQIEHLYGNKAASTLRVLYGGSVNGDNAAGHLKESDGLLIGGASLNAQVFAGIVEKAHSKSEIEKGKGGK